MIDANKTNNTLTNKHSKECLISINWFKYEIHTINSRQKDIWIDHTKMLQRKELRPYFSNKQTNKNKILNFSAKMSKYFKEIACLRLSI